MELVLVGAGVGRTGTQSLKIALEKLLDAPCHHMLEAFGLAVEGLVEAELDAEEEE